jgi:hypothetical protein
MSYNYCDYLLKVTIEISIEKYTKLRVFYTVLRNCSTLMVLFLHFLREFPFILLLLFKSVFFIYKNDFFFHLKTVVLR